jgi:RNA recognition motif-containing protein
MPPKNSKLFVGQLAPETTEQEVRDLFECYGAVRSVYLQRDAAGRSKGSAFVTYGTTDEADTAIYTLHDRHQLAARRALMVRYADNSSDVSAFGRAYGNNSRYQRAAAAAGTSPVEGNEPSTPGSKTSVTATAVNGGVPLPHVGQHD